MVHAYIQDIVAEGSEVEGHPWLHDNFEASLGYMKSHFKKTNQTHSPRLSGTSSLEADVMTSPRKNGYSQNEL